MLTWKTVAAHTREARDKLEAVAHLAYARYEIWRDDLTLAEFADRSPQQS